MNTLIYNPEAAGYKGFHKKCTAVRFVIDGKNIRDLEVWEMDRSEVVPR